jgi:DNA polymerase
MTDLRSLAADYFTQQIELSSPPHIFADAGTLAEISPVITKNALRDIGPKAASSPNLQGASTPKKASALPFHASKLLTPASAVSASSAALTGKRALLAQLYYQVKNCQNCGLGKTRKNFVFGTGNPEARFMVIGEAPGEEEDLQGQPFVGAAGTLLTKMLGAIDIDRKLHVFITNILKSRPPQNRNPEPSEILACSPILSRQIDIIAPNVILLLGRIAAHAVLQSSDSISKLRARVHEYRGISVFVTYHPAALLRNDEYRRPAWEDLQKLQVTLKEIGVYDAEA